MLSIPAGMREQSAETVAWLTELAESIRPRVEAAVSLSVDAMKAADSVYEQVAAVAPADQDAVLSVADSLTGGSALYDALEALHELFDVGSAHVEAKRQTKEAA